MGIFFETIRKPAPETEKPEKASYIIKEAERIINENPDKEPLDFATETQIEMTTLRERHGDALEEMGKKGHLYKSVSYDESNGQSDVKFFGQINGHAVEVHDIHGKYAGSPHYFSGTLDGKYQMKQEEIDSFLHRYAKVALDYDKEQELSEKISDELDEERVRVLKSVL